MIAKGFVVLVMLVILYSLGSGLYFLLKDNGDTNRAVKALSWRIGLSLSLFILLFVAFYFGLITPSTVIGQ